MNTDAFDRLIRPFRLTGTRRAALSGLLGAAVTGVSLGTAAAKPEPFGEGKSESTGTSRSNRGRRGRSHGRVNAEAKKTKPGNRCISPGGVNLNAALGISAQILGPTPPFGEGCDEVGSGERWTVAGQLWAMAQTFESEPEDFEPAGETPLEDFVAKFEAVKYVIDPGSQQEKIAVIPNSDALFVIDSDEGLDLVTPTTLGTVKPLAVGNHAVDVFWVFSAMHCDGLGVELEENCFPAGETRFPFLPTVEFEVVPGHN